MAYTIGAELTWIDGIQTETISPECEAKTAGFPERLTRYSSLAYGFDTVSERLL